MVFIRFDKVPTKGYVMSFMSREQFDSIVKYHLSPVVGRIRLVDPRDPSYIDQLNTAYDRIFDDFNNVLTDDDIAGNADFVDHPAVVVLDDVSYAVNVDRDSDDEIEYFQLVDSDDEIVFEADWQGSITADEIVEMYRSHLSANAVVEDASAGSNVDDSSPVVDFSFFDKAFPHLVNYPDRFKKIAMERFESFSHESFRFQEIVVGDLVDYFDECVDEGAECVDEFYQVEES